MHPVACTLSQTAPVISSEVTVTDSPALYVVLQCYASVIRQLHTATRSRCTFSLGVLAFEALLYTFMSHKSR